MNLATLTTVISSMLKKLSELFSARRAPAGYRPGGTLEYLRRNLGVAGFTSTGPVCAMLELDGGDLEVTLVERTQAQLLMHLVMA